jgi:hypothetical protein
MNLSRKSKWGAVAVVAVALVAGASAFAATKLHTSNATTAGSGGARVGGPVAAGGYGSRDGDGRGGGFRGGGPGGSLSAAASYLGLSSSDLFTQIRSGKSLAQIANATSGKSASGLIDAMVAAEKTEIEQAVTSGGTTRSQADQLEADLKTRVAAMVNGTGFGGPPGGGRGFGGPGDGGGGNGGTAPTATTPTQHI